MAFYRTVVYLWVTERGNSSPQTLAKDYEIADAISSYWANFIKCGNPNGDGLPVWPKSNDNYGYIELGDDFLGKNGVDEPLEKLILEFITREYQLMDGELYE